MEEMVKSIAEKLMSAAKYSGEQAVACLDTVSPPEKRSQQINQLFVALKSSTGEAVAWFQEAFPAAGDKVSYFLSAVQHSGEQAVAWLDTVSPPEKRCEQISEWAHVVKPYAVTAVVLVVLYRVCGCLGGGGGGKGKKTMKAPGRNHRIPRSDFEKNPKAYFEKHRRSS